MWLLNTRTKKLEYFVDEYQQKYAILSHTWADEEVSFCDVENGIASGKKGYEKILYTCSQALKDGLSYAWIDTCCTFEQSIRPPIEG